MEEIEKKKRGRPGKGGRNRNHPILIRLTDDEFENLKYVCSKKGKSMTDIVSNGIRMQANLCRCTEDEDEYVDGFDDNFDDYEDDYYD